MNRHSSFQAVLTLTTLAVASAAFAVSDVAIRLPPQYNGFLLPQAGQSYSDPVFGTIIKRVSDAAHTPNRAVPGAVSFIGT